MRRFLVTTAALALLLGLSVTPASAAQPLVEHGSASFTADIFGAVSECGAPIVTDVDVTFTMIVRETKDGGILVTDHTTLHAVLTNTDNGESTKVNWGQTVHVTVGGGTDGRDVVKITGLLGHILEPGSSPAAHDSGQLVLEAFGPGDPDPIFVLTRGLFEGMGGPFPELCEILT